jgi:alkanesulfonate monooxygenase SsuD/methylene tetrahydromethanopterin reductase-like flavin-dependent oxidoreductase (luciferase family)
VQIAPRQSILARLGVQPLINAHSRLTRLGGSLMAPHVLEAMLEASRHFYDMFELQDRVGEHIAALTRNEAAYVTSGAAAGLVLATAATGHLSFARGAGGSTVPPELVPAIERLVKGYRPQEHQAGAGSANARLVEELGLTDYMARRFALAGTPDACIAQARALAAVGVQGLMLTITTPDPLRTIRALGEQVLPAFQ